MGQRIAVVVMMAVTGCTAWVPAGDRPCEGDVTITSGAEMGDFVARGCTAVTGNLLIIGTDLTIVNLPALRTVGRLDIAGNAALAHVSLPALESASSAVGFDSNAALAHVTLPALKDGVVYFFYNEQVASVSLPAMTAGYLSVVGTNALTSLSLPVMTTGSVSVVRASALTSLSLPVMTEGGVEVVANAALTSLSVPALVTATELVVAQNDLLTSLSLPVLAAVPSPRSCFMMSGCVGGVVIAGNPSLGSLILPALTTAGYLGIVDNAALRGVSLPSLATATVADSTTFGGRGGGSGLLVALNPALQALDAPVLAEVGPLQVFDNPALASLGLPALTKATTLNVTGNSAYSQCLANEVLAGLEGFSGTPTFYGNDESACMPNFHCGGDVWITNDAELAAFAAQGCAEVTGSLHLKGAGLTSVSLPDLTRVGADLIAEGNTLTSLSFPALTTVDGWLAIRDSATLTGFSLAALSAVGGYLFVWNDSALTSFSFPQLTTVGGWMYVSLDAALTSFSFPALVTAGSLSVTDDAVLSGFSLPALTTVGWLNIRDNPGLPECLALAFKDHLVADHGFTGPWSIFYNDTTATCPP